MRKQILIMSVVLLLVALSCTTTPKNSRKKILCGLKTAIFSVMENLIIM